jgi:hypothetical protein
MEEMDPTERRARRAIGWGALTMLAFATLLVIWTLASQFGGYHVPPPHGMNPAWLGSVALGVATLAGLGAVVYGLILLSRRGHER